MKPSNDKLSAGSAIKPKKPRAVSKSRFQKTEKEFNALMKQRMDAENTKVLLKTQTDLRKRVISIDQTTGDAITAEKLNNYQIALSRKQLAEVTLEVKECDRKLAKVGVTIQSLSRKSAEAATVKASRIKTNLRLSRQAAKNYEKILLAFREVADPKTMQNRQAFEQLKPLALSNNGRQFYAAAQKFIKNTAWKPEILEMIKASSQVRSMLANEFRKMLGWTPNK
ncbi:MAG: hypothetical protein LWX56_00720 [Ignavibacteria bacterium]|nr:hypothetical protein [Ignavibacteria bacterium]